MEFITTPLPDAYLIEPSPVTDNRGWFSRIYCKEEYAAIAPAIDWVQFNNSFTNRSGSVRGMHYQLNPFGEIKLIRCISGSVYDVIIDVRQDSPTFLKWFGAILSSDSRIMMFVPQGFAHGFQTLTDNCELIYAHTSSYKPGYEGAIRYNDPAIGIVWPLGVTEISERDQTHPFLTNEFKGIKKI